ncbi:MAG: beta strand repeat-containing protein [Pseudomonadota bacterium]
MTYSITVANTGITAANLTTLVDVLPGQATAVVLNQVPSRFNYVATNSIVINGVPVSGATVVVTPPAAPATTNSETITWTFPPGTTIPAGQQMVVTFTATAGGTLATNVMLYGTAYSNTATINCSANCVTTPAIAATKTTGLTAAATLTAPNLQLLKTIDCVFDGLGVCAPGSYLVGSSIPVSAKLRYKIDYTNPESAAQTITLTDTLPAKTTAAGNLYVASGPDIRPSAPVLSVNPAAAGAPRGVDAALTAIAASTVVNFTAASLPAGSSGTLYVDVQNNATTGVTTNTASINSTQRVAAGGAAVTSAVSATAAALTITKTSNVSTIGPGGNVIYTVTVTNPGAVGVVLTNVVDTLPKPLPNLAGRTILCATSVATCLATTTVTINGVAAAAPTLAQTAPTATVGQINTWTLAGTAAARTLNPGQTMVLSFTATYSATVLPGNTYSNTATSNYTGGTTTTGLVAPVTVPYNTISVSKAVASPISASIAPNSPVTYAITVTNTGATNVPITSVVDSLPAATVGTIAYTSTTSVLVNGIAQTGVAGAPVGAQYTNPAPLAAVPGVQQAVTWTFPAAGTTVINPGQTMVITFVAQYGAVPTGVTYFNDVVANYTGGATTSESVSNVAPVSVPPLSKITKTIDCIYNPTCAAGTYVDGTPIPVNAKLGYKIVYENLSATPASGIIVTDTLPTQTGANSISNLVVNGTPTAAPPSAGGGATVTLLTGGTLPALGSGIITFAVQTTATAGAGVTNTGKMTSTQDPLGVTSLATAAAAGGNLTVSKAVTPATSSTVAQGGVVSYTISVKNDGSASATLTSLADTLPGTPAAAPGTTSRFTYTATGAITLNGVAIAPAFTTVVTPPAVPATTNKETVTWTFTGGVVIPAGQTFKLTFTATVGTLVSKGAAAPGITYYNDIVANYTGGAFPSASVSSQAPVLVPFDTLTMSKTIDCVYDAAAIPVCQPYTLGAPIPAAAKLRYRLAYDNISPTAQVVTIKDTLPTAVTAAGNLYVGSGPNVRPSTPALSQNAALAGAPRGPDVALTAIAGGTVVAMTAVSLPGSSSGTLFLDVQTNALSGATVSNCASISTVAANNCATPGVVSSTSTVSVQNAAVLNISKTTSTPTLTPGGTATYTISITNNGTAATQSLKVYDFLPYSGGVVDATKRVAYVAASSVYSGGLPVPTITTSVAPTVSPYASDPNQQQVLWDFGAYALPIGATVTITFNATVGANMPGGSYYNSVRYEQTSAGINFSANADAQALIAVSSAQPSLTLLKMVNPFWDPFNGTPDPLVFAPDAKNIPGAIVEYTVIATNSGTGPADNNSIVITDPIPADGSLFVNPISGGLAVILTNGATASGLTIPLTAADIDFFGGSPTPGWGYVPVAGADGCDPLVSSLKVNPKGIFVGNPTPPSPSFNLKFRVCVK